MQVGHLERFNPAVMAAARILTQPLFFEAHRLSLFSPRSLDIDVVMDLMIHDIDVVLSFVGSACIGSARRRRSDPDAANRYRQRADRVRQRVRRKPNREPGFSGARPQAQILPAWRIRFNRLRDAGSHGCER